MTFYMEEKEMTGSTENGEMIPIMVETEMICLLIMMESMSLMEAKEMIP